MVYDLVYLAIDSLSIGFVLNPFFLIVVSSTHISFPSSDQTLTDS